MSGKSKNNPPSWKWHHKRETLITLRWKKSIPRLVIHEKYQNIVKWSLRVLIILTIISSVLYIPVWYWSLLSVLAQLAIEQFLERAIFLYTIFYLQPMPNFKWNIGEEWVAMSFAFPVNKNEGELNIVGPGFKSGSCAHEFFELLRKWNYGNEEDKENNICLSFVTIDSGYYAFIYPNFERESIKRVFTDIEESSRLNKYGKEPQEFVMQQIFCKFFDYGINSLFKRFSQEQTPEQPYWLLPFLQNPTNGNTSIIFSEQPILKFHIKIKQRNKLERTEIEYQHFRNVIDVNRKEFVDR